MYVDKLCLFVCLLYAFKPVTLHLYSKSIIHVRRTYRPVSIVYCDSLTFLVILIWLYQKIFLPRVLHIRTKRNEPFKNIFVRVFCL